jgi:subtilisin-like proprotein convertase family protein
MADFAGGDLGTLTSWSITINYASPDAGIWTPVTGLFTNAAGTTPYVAGTPASTVYASPAATTTYSVTVTNSSTETRTFSTGGTITIPGVAPASTSSGAGAPYPSAVSVSGLPANAVVKSVTLRRIRHSWSSDIDVLLQSPTGNNVVLMSDVGSSGQLNYVTYTFDDAGGAMSTSAGNATGTYRPTNNGASDTYPAPIGAITQASPALSLFTGDPNGTWNLYIADGASGDIGMLSSWEITFTIPTATNCTSAPRTVTVTVHVPITFTSQPANVTACQNGNVTFISGGTGTIQTTQWQVSTNGGGTWTNITGATSTTLTLTSVQPSQNGYRYRLALGNAGCGTVYSNAAILTVNPLPTVSLTLNPAGQTQLRPGLQTTVTVNSSPAGASYQWFVNGVSQPITGSSYVVDAYHLGTYTVRVTDVNGCVNTTAGVTFTAIATSQLFIYPNPTTGAYYVTYYMRNPVPVTINVIDMKGRRIVQRQETTTGPYTRFDFSNEKLAAGVYVIEFRDPSENLLATGRLVVLR